MKLHGKIQTSGGGEPAVLRLTRFANLPVPVRHQEALIVDREECGRAPSGFGALVLLDGCEPIQHGSDLVVAMPEDLGYLEAGDIVRLNPQAGQARVLYRRSSRHNSLLVTERCNSKCTMCSQPPRDIDDRYLVDDILTAIPLMSADTPELGITGGEPTLLHDDLIRIVESARDYLPRTALHILSNGRLLAYTAYVRKLAEVEHPDLMLGIPVYSDLPDRHDFVVQARGAFDQTIRGILNLGRFRQRVEIRVVLHRHTYERLPQLATFIGRNLPFVEHVALMGLEMMGYARTNLDALWIDPVDYQVQLRECAWRLQDAGIPVSIYNHQLCVLDRSLWRFARQSISDWKNTYMPECDTCAVRQDCGGFFASAALRYSEHIRALAPESVCGC